MQQLMLFEALHGHKLCAAEFAVVGGVADVYFQVPCETWFVEKYFTANLTDVLGLNYICV